MKTRAWTWRLAAVAAVAAALCGCADKKPVLHIYTWSDYVKPELVRQFEWKHGCRVVIDTYASNEEMYAKLKAGASGYDLLFPSSYMVQIMHNQGMLRKLDHARLPNLRNLDATYLAMAVDREMDHSVPYTVSITCLGWRGGQLPDAQPSWSMFDRADLKGRVTLLDDYRETIGAALKFLGCSLNTTDDAELARAKEVVLRWKQNVAKFENEQYKTGLASGEFLLTHGYSGDLMLVQAENADIQVAVPREGSALSFDDMVIPAEAKQADLAHAFINFVLDPRVAAELTEYIFFVCPNEVSYQYLQDETRHDPILFPPPDVVERLEMIADLGENNAKYARLWDEIKAGH